MSELRAALDLLATVEAAEGESPAELEETLYWLETEAETLAYKQGFALWSSCLALPSTFAPFRAAMQEFGQDRAAALLPRNPVRLKRLRCVAPGLPRRSCGVDAPLREDGPRGTPDDAHPSAVQLPRAHCAGAGFGVECGRVSHRERERRRRRPDLQCCRGPDTRETLVKSKAT